MSGFGKTTLLGLLGLLDTPTGGEVRIAGHATSRLLDREIAAQAYRHITMRDGRMISDQVDR